MNQGPRNISSLLCVILLAVVCVLTSWAADSDIPKTFDAPTSGQDYVKREVMIPMRDGVKLHTVIVVPKGAQERADSPDPHALQRLQARRAQRQPAHARDPAAGRRSLRGATATSASFRTCAASTNPRAIT